MGFNVSGIVINKNYSNNVAQLQTDLNWELEFAAAIDFETASANWKDEGICDIYFSEHGTLLFASMEKCIEPSTIPGQQVFSFALSETSMAFNLHYCEGLTVKRSITEVGGERMVDEGDALPIENTTTDISAIIWGQLAAVLGKTFWSIEPDEKAQRYTITNA